MAAAQSDMVNDGKRKYILMDNGSLSMNKEIIESNRISRETRRVPRKGGDSRGAAVGKRVSRLMYIIYRIGTVSSPIKLKPRGGASVKWRFRSNLNFNMGEITDRGGSLTSENNKSSVALTGSNSFGVIVCLTRRLVERLYLSAYFRN